MVEIMADIYLTSNEHLVFNKQIINSSRVVTSLIGGCAAGILGITGWNGLFFYILVTALTSILLMLKANFHTEKYFIDKNGPLFEGSFAGVMTYMLCWTFFYDVTHVYS
eukprot:TRINITY_DN12509_c0_g1_i1.p1 TRINITY_DN12509_c0_g1~~TRINITY_DN12509_c0_g1_i1.p1  ORF type:complete len:109 (-),score=4.96 TRINITY_DN12509_c0_g1_i1:44-370(-)